MYARRFLSLFLAGGLALLAGASPALQAQTVGPQVTITEYPLPTAGSTPGGLVVGPDQNIWFHEPGANQIGRITTNGSLSEYAIPTPQSSLPNQGFVALGPDQAVWFSETRANKLGRISPSGTITEYAIPSAVTREDPKLGTITTSFPGGIAAGPDGAIWFTETDTNKIGRMTLAGQFTEYPLPTPASRPLGLIVGPDGALWYTAVAGNLIGRITTDGTVTEYPLPTPASVPLRLTVGPDNAIWFCLTGTHTIGRITRDGTISEYPVPGMGPVFITTGPDGAMWFTGYTSNEIGRMTLDGILTNRYASPTPASQPYHIVTGPDRSLWFTQNAGNKIGRLQIHQAPAIPLPDTGVEGAPVLFPETGYSLEGDFLNYWQAHGGLPVFGYPIASARQVDSQVVQWLERTRFELHPNNQAPYNVLLGRLGAEALQQQGRPWQSLPKASANASHSFAATGHAITFGPFWSYWTSHGLEFDGRAGTSTAESLALFGYPISEATMEQNASGDVVLTQWFERARFEYHPSNPAASRVLLGRLGAEVRNERGR